ncbi:retrovirus-related pol polyprotein from transposon TNT 1-94, partial [Tanacetum coccineum]
MIIRKDSEIVKEKVERKSIALKAKKQSSDKECLTSGSEDKSHASRDENSSIDDLALDNEYDKLCKMSLKIITKNKRLKATRNSLEKEIRELKDKLSTLEKNKGVNLECTICQSLKIQNGKLKEEALKLTKFEKSTHCLNKMLSNQKPSSDKLGLGFNSFEASSSGTKEIKFVKAQKKASSDGVDLEPDEWIKDSGCSKHMTGKRKLFSTYKAYNGGNVIFGSNLRNNIIGKGYSQNSKAYIILNKHTRKVEESFKVTFDKTPPPSKTSPLVDDDLDKEEAIKVTEKKNLESDIVDETLEINKIFNVKESRNHPLENMDSVGKSAPVLKACLKASKIRNIDGKNLGKDGNPLRPIRSDFNKGDSSFHVDLNTEQQNDGLYEDANFINCSFAKVVNSEKPSKKSMFRTLINSEHVENVDFVLPLATLTAAQQRCANSLVGYFVGKNVAFPLVQNYVTTTWGKFGFQKVIKDEDGFFYFKFSSLTGLEQVLEQGPWLIRNIPIILTKWSPNLSLTKDKVTKIHVMGYARALTEVSTEKELKKEVIMAVPEVEGTGHTNVKICHVFGNNVDLCPKRVVEIAKVNVEDKDDGFTTVTNRKKKAKQPQARKIESVKINKPKATFVYHPKISEPAHTMETESEDIDLFKLKNQFDSLRDQDDLLRKNDVGETSRANLKDQVNEDLNNDLESEVEEIVVESVNNPKGDLQGVLVSHLSRKRGSLFTIVIDWLVTTRWLLIVVLGYIIQEFFGTYSMKRIIRSEGFDTPRDGFGKYKLLLVVNNLVLLAFISTSRWIQDRRRISTANVEYLYWCTATNKVNIVSFMLILLRSTASYVRYQIKKNVNTVRVELDEAQKALDVNPNDSILRDKEAVYLQAFIEAKFDEERFLKKTKIKWLDVVTGPNVADVFVSQYEMFLRSDLTCQDLNSDALFVKQVSPDSCTNMVRPVSDEEIKVAMFSIGDDRAPGSDGYSSAFFKKGWDIIGSDVCHAIRYFFVSGRLLKEINHNFIALIPKVPTPLKVNEYRPISCCNVIYKCISKILTNRIINGIKEVVNENQSAFVLGRSISDNILITQELMHNYHRNRGPSRCAFKINIQKAYDTVDWQFLD